MYNNWNYVLKMDFLLTIMFISLMFVSGENVASAENTKETSNVSQNSPADSQTGEHTVAKRAWSQLQGSWGKRNNIDDEPKQDSLEELQRKVMQLLANRVEDAAEYVPDYYDAPVEKRAWKSMSNAWGKRDWSQMRGSGWGKREEGNWNNMRGLWGKRSPGWNKLSSAWGK